ncbi:MAG: hypothetical protein WC308_02285 [archaeon]|jgi:hypothetical protein
MVSKKRAMKRTFRKQPSKSKETVRVKTFIVEKPVYVPSKGLVERDFEEEERIAAKDYDSKWSSHFRKRMPEFAKAPRGEKDDVDEKDFNEEKKEDEVADDYSEDESEDAGNEEFGNEKLSEVDVNAAMGSAPTGHARSRGLFNNSWWKKAILKGFAIWLAILVLAYIMDFLKMVNVEGMINWAGFLAFLIMVSLIYEKFLKGKVNV